LSLTLEGPQAGINKSRGRDAQGEQRPLTREALQRNGPLPQEAARMPRTLSDGVMCPAVRRVRHMPTRVVWNTANNLSACMA